MSVDPEFTVLGSIPGFDTNSDKFIGNCNFQAAVVNNAGVLCCIPGHGQKILQINPRDETLHESGEPLADSLKSLNEPMLSGNGAIYATAILVSEARVVQIRPDGESSILPIIRLGPFGYAKFVRANGKLISLPCCASRVLKIHDGLPSEIGPDLGDVQNCYFDEAM